MQKREVMRVAAGKQSMCSRRSQFNETHTLKWVISEQKLHPLFAPHFDIVRIATTNNATPAD